MNKWTDDALQYVRRLGFARSCAGVWLMDKFTAQCQVSGVQQAARNLRKQGVPLHVALMMVRGI